MKEMNKTCKVIIKEEKTARNNDKNRKSLHYPQRKTFK